MPGHFTHIYTARRVADLLSSGTFTDWPDLGAGGDAVAGLNPKTCGDLMSKWEKFTAIGAIGPDLFFFSQDWNNPALEPHSDDIMLALAIYYYYDFAKENDWEPLIAILRGVDSTMANLLELVIKLQKIWDKFVDVWNKTIGPIVGVVGDLTDDLTGGVLSELRDYLTEFVNELVAVGVEDVSQWAHIWDRMNTVVAKGYPEGAFLWSDMTHYRRTTATCQALVHQAQLLRDGSEGSEGGPTTTPTCPHRRCGSPCSRPQTSRRESSARHPFRTTLTRGRNSLTLTARCRCGWPTPSSQLCLRHLSATRIR